MNETAVLETIVPVSHDLGAFKVHRTCRRASGRWSARSSSSMSSAGAAPCRPGHGRPPASAHQPRHRDLSVRRRHRASRQHRLAPVIQPGAINLMTAGKGIVHSERCPPSCARRPEPLRHADLARPAGRARGDRPGVRMSQRRLPLIEDGGARARVMMGTLWGDTRADALPFADHLRRYRARRRRARCRSRPKPTSARSCWSAAKRSWMAMRSTSSRSMS